MTKLGTEWLYGLLEGSIWEIEKLCPLLHPEEATSLEAATGPPALHPPPEQGCLGPGPRETVLGGKNLYGNTVSTCESLFPEHQQRVGGNNWGF